MQDRNERYRRYEEFFREGWIPVPNSKSYECGYCGHKLSTRIGWFAQTDRYPYGFLPERSFIHVYICTHCGCPTTFCVDQQIPSPATGQDFDATDKTEDVQVIVELYNEAREALRHDAPSCATLMFRKILMHIAVAEGAKAGLNFVQYVTYLKDQNVVGRPLYGLLDTIKQRGNDENHQLVRAESHEAMDLLKLTTLLLQSVYFTDS